MKCLVRQALLQLAGAKVAQVEIDGLAVRRGDGAALAFLMPERLAEAVARAELHGLVARPRVDRTNL